MCTSKIDNNGILFEFVSDPQICSKPYGRRKRSDKLLIFLDTNVFQHSINGKAILKSRKSVVEFAGKNIEKDVYQASFEHNFNKNESAALRPENFAINILSILGSEKNISFMKGYYSFFEKSQGRHQGFELPFECELALSPVYFSSIMDENYINKLEEFLRNIKHFRYKEIQKHRGNKLSDFVDSFLVWSAEFNNADYFVTCETKLANALWNKKKVSTVEILKPTAMVKRLEGLGYNIPKPQPYKPNTMEIGLASLNGKLWCSKCENFMRPHEH